MNKFKAKEEAKKAVQEKNGNEEDADMTAQEKNGKEEEVDDTVGQDFKGNGATEILEADTKDKMIIG